MKNSHTDMYIFLDIDGVFIKEDKLGEQTSLDEDVPTLDAACVEHFADIVTQYEQVKIVISSSWREVFDLSIIKSRFPDSVSCKIEGVTPILTEPAEFFRHQEVLDYLAMAQATDQPWVAIDDIAEHYPPDVPIVVTNPYEGFDRIAALRLHNFLKAASTKN